MKKFSELPETVQRISKMKITGNITPPSWYYRIRSKNKPDLLAIAILSDIIYWYRATEIRNELSDVIGYSEKFRSDKLQKSYDQYANFFGTSKRQVAVSIKKLRDLKLISLEYRTLFFEKRPVSNVLFIDVLPDEIERITYSDLEVVLGEISEYPLLQKNVIGGTKKCRTYTKTTTETTTSSLTKVKEEVNSPSESPTLKEGATKRELLSKPTNGITPVIFIPTDRASAVLSYWNSKKLVHHEEGTKRYKSTCKLIDEISSGTCKHPLFSGKKFKRIDFIKAIDSFALAALNSKYEPTDIDRKRYFSKLCLKDFLINTRSDKSLFLCYLDKKPALAGTINNPDMSPVVQMLSDWYANNVEEKKNKEFTRKEWRDFTVAEVKLKEFLKENKNELLIETIMHLGSLEGAEDEVSALTLYLIGSVEDVWKNSTFTLTTSWFCSDNAFQKRLPDFLRKKGLVRK